MEPETDSTAISKMPRRMPALKVVLRYLKHQLKLGGRMRLRWRRLVSALVTFGTALGITLGISIFAPTSASAWSAGYIYVSYPTWLNNCPQGGSVKGIFAAVDGMWSAPASGDWGDDLVYPRVRLGDWNTISARNFCSKWGLSRRGLLGSNYLGTFYPTRYNQTFWVGPAGQSHN